MSIDNLRQLFSSPNFGLTLLLCCYIVDWGNKKLLLQYNKWKRGFLPAIKNFENKFLIITCSKNIRSEIERCTQLTHVTKGGRG